MMPLRSVETAPARRVIQVEFNELVPRLMDQWIAEGSLPNFKALRARSKAA